MERRVVGIGNGRWARAAGWQASEPLLALEMAAANAVDEVVQMYGDAHVVGNDLHHVAHARAPPARAEIEHAVLL